ncbi:MAG TPA: RNA chaperone Hfq [Clostridia bacterium]|nr:RNA chaperone Hfq [Clostridia bacterium]
MENYRKKDTNIPQKLPLAQSIRMQETFLNHCRREKIDVVIQLFDQSIIEGLIVGFDQESIIISSRGTQQLIYKTSVVCIKPFEELHLIFNENWRTSKTGITYPRVAAHSSMRQH